MTSKAGQAVAVGVVREIVVVVLVRLQLLWIVIQAGMGIRAVLPGVLSTVVGEGEGKEEKGKERWGRRNHHGCNCLTAASLTGSEYIGRTIEVRQMCKSEFIATGTRSETFPGLNVTSIDQRPDVHSAFSQSMNRHKKVARLNFTFRMWVLACIMGSHHHSLNSSSTPLF